MDTTQPKKENSESAIIIVATIVQGIVAVFALIDYLTERVSGWFSQINVFQWVIGLSLATTLILGYILLFRRQRLSPTQKRFSFAITALALSLALFFSGFLTGEGKNTMTVTAEDIDDMPFLLLKNFGFEAGFEGWYLGSTVAPTTMTIEHDESEAFTGSGYIRLKVDLPGTLKDGNAIPLGNMVSFNNADSKRLGLVDGFVGYIMVTPTEQTVDNQFYAEIQVSSDSDTKEYWIKTRYPIEPGKWQPIVWVKPSSAHAYNNDRSESSEVVYWGDQNFLTVMIWSDEPYTGTIKLDDFRFYIIERP